MAIGDFGGNSNENNGRKFYDTPYYPRMRIRKEKTNTGLSFEYKSGLLQVKILEINPDGFSYNTETPKGIIYLSPMKATLLAHQLRIFKEYINNDDIDPNKAFGVNGGMGEKISFIAFHADVEKNIIVTIGKFDSDGKIIESADTYLNRDYNYALEWNNLPEMDVTRVFDNDIELNQLMHMFEDFGRYMNGAAAYAQADLTRYDTVRVLNKMDPIYDKLGIERLNRNSNYKPRQNNNFLNNTGTSETKSYQDIQDMFGEA